MSIISFAGILYVSVRPYINFLFVFLNQVSKVRAPKKSRGKSKMIKVHARGPDEKEVVTLNEDGQPVSDNITELSNFLGTLAKDNVSLTYINWHVVPDQLKRQMLEYTLVKSITLNHSSTDFLNVWF